MTVDEAIAKIRALKERHQQTLRKGVAAIHAHKVTEVLEQENELVRVVELSRTFLFSDELGQILSRAQADRAIVERLPVKVEYQELCNEVWRFAKAYPLGLENAIAPMNKIAIEQAVKLLAALASTPQPGQGDEGRGT